LGQVESNPDRLKAVRLTVGGTIPIIDKSKRLEAISESMAEATKVDEALARFEAALRRLESVAMRVQDIGSAPTADSLSALDDRELLAQEIKEVRAKANELAERNRNAASKIDSAMAKIKSVLG
jgi:hypothetical protein